MPALDATRRVFNPIDNRFLTIPDNVQFIAAVNRGSEFSGTFGIDAAQLDRILSRLGDLPGFEVLLQHHLRVRRPALGFGLADDAPRHHLHRRRLHSPLRRRKRTNPSPRSR